MLLLVTVLINSRISFVLSPSLAKIEFFCKYTEKTECNTSLESETPLRNTSE